MEIILKLFLWLCLGLTSNIQCELPRGTNLTVTTKLGGPYTLLRGPNKYEGYIVDLIDAISKILQFNYVLKITSDNAYGSFNSATGKWNGMIADIVSGRADIAAGDLTITRERETVVDFTYPFMKFGIGMVHKRDSSGLETFRNVEEVASQSDVTYGVVSGGSVQYFFNHSRNPIYNKIWKSIKSTVPQLHLSIATTKAFTYNVCSLSCSNIFLLIGFERAMQGGYVFFTESPGVEFITRNRCELYQVCGLLNSRGFGLAVQQGSSIRNELNLAILELEESGTLDELKNKWWKEKPAEGSYLGPIPMKQKCLWQNE